MVSAKDYCNVMRLQFKENKFIVISNVIGYQPLVGQFTAHNMAQLSITTSSGFFIDQNATFLPILLRIDLDFPDLIPPVF